jgi:hypothetical protein
VSTSLKSDGGEGKEDANGDATEQKLFGTLKAYSALHAISLTSASLASFILVSSAVHPPQRSSQNGTVAKAN